MSTTEKNVDDLVDREYAAGFVTDIESDTFPPGLSEDVVRAISAKKGEPEWMTEWRLKAYRHWLTMDTPDWAHLNIPPIDAKTSAITAPQRNPKMGPSRWMR